MHGQSNCRRSNWQSDMAPAPGYHGVGQFGWDVIDAKTSSHDTAVVQVK